MTLASRITGFIRDTLLAILFGAGLSMDAFVVAFRIPNLLRRLFAEGAFSQAFVPVLGEYRTRKGDEATRELAGKVLADDGCGRPIMPIANSSALRLVAPRADFSFVITPTFDCGRYQSCLKLLERKVGKFPEIRDIYFA